MSRWLAGALALPLGLTGCGLVVFEGEDDGPSPADTTTGSAGTSAAGGGDDAVASDGAGGAGGSSTTTSAGPGGGAAAAAPPPITSCRSLGWYGDTIVHPLNVQHVSHGLSLAHVARAEDPLDVAGSIALVVPYAEPDPDEHEEGVELLEAWHTWEELVTGDLSRDAHLREVEQHEWADPEATPVRAVGPGRGGFAAYVREKGGASVREGIPEGGFPLPSGIEAATDLAWSDRGVYALVHGVREAPRIDLVVPGPAPIAMPAAVAACADRPVPIDVAPLGDGFVVASAPGSGSSCSGAPTPPARVVLTLLDEGGGVRSERELAVDGVPHEVSLVAHPGGAWLAIRLEGRDAVTLTHLDPGGAATVRGEVALASDRALALALRLEELVVVDTGADPPARIRTFTPDLTPIAETPPPPFELALAGAPVVHVRADGGAMLVATLVRQGAPPERVIGLRARCEEVER